MEKERLTEIVLNEIAEVIEVDKNTISAESSLMDDLDISSLEVMVLMGNLETKTGVVIDIKEMSSLATVSDIVDKIMEKMAEEQH